MMVLEGRRLVSLVGKKCGGQSFDDIIMVARANKNHKQKVMYGVRSGRSIASFQGA